MTWRHPAFRRALPLLRSTRSSLRRPTAGGQQTPVDRHHHECVPMHWVRRPGRSPLQPALRRPAASPPPSSAAAAGCGSGGGPSAGTSTKVWLATRKDLAVVACWIEQLLFKHGGRALPLHKPPPPAPMRITIDKAKRGLSSLLPGQADVGRPDVLGNPFVVGRDGSLQEVIGQYRRWLGGRLQELGSPLQERELRRLLEQARKGERDQLMTTPEEASTSNNAQQFCAERVVVMRAWIQCHGLERFCYQSCQCSGPSIESVDLNATSS